MKKIIILAFLFITAANLASAQNSQVLGNMKRYDSTLVKLDTVELYVDTNAGPQVFPPMQTMTDTSGDYIFNFPASTPIGTVLKVSAKNCDGLIFDSTYVYTGNKIICNLRVCVTAPQKFDGYVHLGGPNKRPVPGNARVYLIEKCPGNVSAVNLIDSVTTDTNGYYSFGSTYPTINIGCELIMRARLLSQSPDYTKYLPAYTTSNTSYSLRWSGGQEITSSMAFDGVNMLLPEAHNPFGGPCHFGGMVVDAGTGSTGSALPGRIILMTDFNDVPVAYTYSDANGQFKISNIQFGTYKLFGDSWGRSNPDLLVKVDANKVVISNILFEEIDTTVFKGKLLTGIGQLNNQHLIKVYPNPVDNILNISGLSTLDDEDINIEILNSVGQKVYSDDTNSNTDKVIIPVNSLVTGIYILHISTKQGIMTYRFSK